MIIVYFIVAMWFASRGEFTTAVLSLILGTLEQILNHLKAQDNK
jgi:hypothetical protein